ncbi:hypothetical protein E8P82_11790 [Arthrobacter echini]|uniref:Uncharacterized protein n=1 Tax=Arthrobacter echini TaxID=1529066 RepID=A0A4S5E2N0_9MICC|nr:hypothetical protein [Arthrobacter echini]THJ65646.1 hypothetical protein E8P82_11790 [Arthrobacter echini]
MSPAVHSWPVIRLTIGEGEIVADANGDVLTYPVLDEASAADVAADAAAEACRRLGLTACRVQGLTEDGEVYEMVVDAELGTLEERENTTSTGTAGGTGAGAARTGSTTARRRTPARRKAVLWGSAGVLAATVGFSAFSTLQDSTAEPVATVFTPPPAQLPVPAPAGWDTYGDWTTPMTGSTVRAVLDPSGQPVSVDGSKLIGHDPRTGVERWTRTAPFTVAQLALFTLDGQSRVAAAAARELVLFGDGADPIRVDVPKDGSIVLDGGTAPRVDLPNKRTLIVAADGSTSVRVVPAAAEPIEALGDDLVAADTRSGRIWRVTQDSAALPAPAKLPAPSAGAELVTVLGSVNGTVVAAWKTNNNTTTTIGFYALGDAADATETTQVGIVDVEGTDIATSDIQVDRENGLLMAGTLLVDVDAKQAHRLPGAGKLAAGYAWVTTNTEQLRINAHGVTETTTDTARAAIPDVITDDGKAITRAEGSPTDLLYALTQVAPRPTATPTPTSALTSDPTSAPSPTSTVSPKENP